MAGDLHFISQCCDILYDEPRVMDDESQQGSTLKIWLCCPPALDILNLISFAYCMYPLRRARCSALERSSTDILISANLSRKY